MGGRFIIDILPKISICVYMVLCICVFVFTNWSILTMQTLVRSQVVLAQEIYGLGGGLDIPCKVSIDGPLKCENNPHKYLGSMKELYPTAYSLVHFS